jgi:hypothetical protein
MVAYGCLRLRIKLRNIFSLPHLFPVGEDFCLSVVQV